MARTSRRSLAILGVVAVLIAALVLRRQVTIPSDASSPPVARAALVAVVKPDTDTQSVPANGVPAGQACLTRISGGNGWLDLCWSGSWYGRKADGSTDYYLLRLYGSHQGFRWLSLRSLMIGTLGDGFLDSWPDGMYEGACRQEPVGMLVPLIALAPDDICGRTEGHANASNRSAVLSWTCDGCLVPDGSTRGVSMYAVVGGPAGDVPSWDRFANGGS
jgi:hypothetical protein